MWGCDVATVALPVQHGSASSTQVHAATMTHGLFLEVSTLPLERAMGVVGARG